MKLCVDVDELAALVRRVMRDVLADADVSAREVPLFSVDFLSRCRFFFKIVVCVLFFVFCLFIWLLSREKKNSWLLWAWRRRERRAAPG